MDGTSRRGAALLALIAIGACDEATPLPGPGERCAVSLVSACAVDLVCVDGLCRSPASAPTPEAPPPGPIASFDVVPTDAQADASAPNDDAEPTSDTTDSGDPAVERVTLTTWDPTAPADTRLALGVGQAAVVEVSVTIESRAEVLFAAAWRPDGPACGLFRPLIWLPRTSPATPGQPPIFPVMPDLIGVAQPISTTAGSPTFAALPLDPSGAVLTRAPHRVGVRYEGPCTSNALAPFIQLDASGEADQTWVWADAWIPGADLGLPGRWAFALQLLVE